MKKKSIAVNLLDYNGITKAIEELQAWEKDFQIKVDNLAQALAEKGVEIGKGKILSYPAVFSGELVENLHFEKKTDCVYAIISDTDHSAFVEFGTGQLGSVVPYPYPFPPDMPSWDYNVGEYIQYAEEDLMWGDKVVPKGTYYWFYFKDGAWHLTQGMPSRPFMYETAMDLPKEVAKIAKEIFNA